MFLFDVSLTSWSSPDKRRKTYDLTAINWLMVLISLSMLLISFSPLSFSSPDNGRNINNFTAVNWLIVLISLLILLFSFSLFPFSSPGKRTKKDDFTAVNWLTDLLPNELPEARIMTFNYLSRWHKNAPHQGRRAPSDILLEHLRIDRETVCQPVEF
jgi:hypothetical protein